MVLMAIGGGLQLNTPAGLAYLRARRDGCPAGVNSATRSYEQQLDWYLNQGKKGYPAKADNPNRSKHVWRPNDPTDKGARALDLPAGGPQEWMRQNGHKYGWMKDRVAGEKWHFEYEEWNDPSRFDNNNQTPPTPGVETEGDEDMFELVKQLYATGLGRTGSADEWFDWIKTTERNGWNLTRLIEAFYNSLAERGTVVQAYKDYLGRSPESEAVINSRLASRPTIARVRSDIYNSEEAKKRRG